MPNRALDSSGQGHSSIESCSLQQQLHSWRPFQLQLLHSSSSPTKPQPQPKPTQPLDSSNSPTKPPQSCSNATNGVHNHHLHLHLHPKRPCLSDRATPTSFPVVVDSLDLDMSRLTLMDDDRPPVSARNYKREGASLRWIARKRRRRGSRSISGRSSDRSVTRPLCCSASAAHGTCSDFPVAAGTDSSGELFLNGDANWASDVSEAARNCRKERDSAGAGGIGEKENSIAGVGQVGNFDSQGNESGYGSEPGYRGDGEFGYGDEVDEEEDDQRLLFWGDQFGESNLEMVGENTLQKAHHRCRRKKHDLRMVNPFR